MDLTEENRISLGMLIWKNMMLTTQDMMPHDANYTRKFFGLAETVQKNK